MPQPYYMKIHITIVFSVSNQQRAKQQEKIKEREHLARKSQARARCGSESSAHTSASSQGRTFPLLHQSRYIYKRAPAASAVQMADVSNYRSAGLYGFFTPGVMRLSLSLCLGGANCRELRLQRGAITSGWRVETLARGCAPFGRLNARGGLGELAANTHAYARVLSVVITTIDSRRAQTNFI